MRVNYHSEARTELLEAVQFLDSRQCGLGSRFVSRYEEALASIGDDPERLPVEFEDVRRICVKQFPYAILFVPVHETVYVIAVKHHSRHPDYWKHRL